MYSDRHLLHDTDSECSCADLKEEREGAFMFRRLFSLFIAILTFVVCVNPTAVQAETNNLTASCEIADGTYMIVSGNSSSLVLDINNSNMENGGNLEIFNKNNTLNQRFYVRYENGAYTIMSVNSGKYLHIADERYSNTNVHQWDGYRHPNAQWEIIPAGDGYYYLRNKGNGSYLDNCGGRAAAGNNVIAFPFNGAYSQKWKFVEIDNLYTVNFNDNYFMIVSGNSDQRVLDINGSNQNNGGNLEIFRKNNTKNQRFYLRYENGYFTIMAVHSGKYLHISDEADQTANVHQWSGNRHDNARWYIIPVGDGYYYLQNKATGSYLDNSSACTDPGNNVISYPFNGSAAQKWKFAKTTVSGKGALASDTLSFEKVTFDCSSFDNWLSSVRSNQLRRMNSNKVTVAVNVLSYDVLNCRVPLQGPYKNESDRKYVTKQYRVPKEVVYTLHTHEYLGGYGSNWLYRDQSIILMDSCECGYQTETMEWVIPLPDLSDLTIQQTVDSASPRYSSSSLRWYMTYSN